MSRDCQVCDGEFGALEPGQLVCEHCRQRMKANDAIVAFAEDFANHLEKRADEITANFACANKAVKVDMLREIAAVMRKAIE